MTGIGRRHRALALVLAWATAALGLLIVSSGPALATEEVQVSFTMSSLKVSGYQASDTVTLTGAVTNSGPVNAYGVGVILWRSRDAIQSLTTLRAASSGQVLGARMSVVANHYAVVTTSMQPLIPGETRQVTLSATMGELGFDTPGAAFAFGADVVASPDAGALDFPTVGQLRTFVPIPGKKKVPITSIVLLSAAPTKLADGLFRNDSLAAELTGRLSTLLDAAARPGMSWLIDPALLDEVRDMAGGYLVQAKDGNRTGTGAAAASAWLTKFEQLDDDAGAKTLFAGPDLDGIRRTGDDQALARAGRAEAEVSGLDDLPVVAVPAGGSISAATYNSLAGSEVGYVLARNVTRSGALQAGTGERPKVLGTSSAVPGDAATDQGLRRQFALATAVVAGAGGEVRLLTTGADLLQDEEAFGSWLVRRDLDDLLDSAPSRARASLTQADPLHLTKAQYQAVSRLKGGFAAHAELAPTSSLTDQSDAALTRSIASAWIGDPRGFSDYNRGLERLVGLGEMARSVSLEVSPRFVMSSRANQFPVTISNDLSEEIRVKVVVVPDNPQRLTVPPTDAVTVGPGRSVTVNIHPEAVANGLVLASAYVATESGRRVTPDTPVTIEVTDIGVVAWIIVAASALVLIGATAWRIRQVRRREAGSIVEAAPERTAG